jgi:hypothetical protein
MICMHFSYHPCMLYDQQKYLIWRIQHRLNDQVWKEAAVVC